MAKVEEGHYEGKVVFDLKKQDPKSYLKDVLIEVARINTGNPELELKVIDKPILGDKNNLESGDVLDVGNVIVIIGEYDHSKISGFIDLEQSMLEFYIPPPFNNDRIIGYDWNKLGIQDLKLKKLPKEK